MQEFKLAVGLRLREARQDAGISQRKAADRLGISSVALYQIEAGRNMPVVRVQDLAAMYEVELRKLFEGLGLPVAKTEKDLPLVRLVETEMSKCNES